MQASLWHFCFSFDISYVTFSSICVKSYLLGGHLKLHELRLSTQNVPRCMNLHKTHPWYLALMQHINYVLLVFNVCVCF